MHLDKIFDFENNAIAEKNCKNSDFAVAWKSCKIAVKEAIENNPPKAAIDRVQNESIEEEFVFSAKNNAFRCYVKLTKLPILPISTVDFLDEIKFNSQTLTLTRTHSHTEVKTGEEINSTTKRNQKPAESTQKCTKKNEAAKRSILTKIDVAPNIDRKYPRRKCTAKLEPALENITFTKNNETSKTDQKYPKRKCTTKLEPPAKKRAIANIDEQPPKTARKYPKRKCTTKLKSK